MDTKKILVDIYKIKDIHSGLGQFSWNFAMEIAKRMPDDFSFTFLTPAGKDQMLKLKGNVLRATSVRRYFPLVNTGFDLWHSLHQFPAHRPAKGVKQLLTIHDLNFLTEKNTVKARKYLRKLQNDVDHATAITTISNFTRQHLEEHLDLKGKDVFVVYNGVSLPAANPRKPDFIDSGKFFFSLSVFKKAKNFHVLLPLMRHFKEYKLILAGNNNTEYGNEIKHLAESMGMQNQILFPGTISDAEKLWLYQHCEAFFFPSLAEGFGLPVIEAMMCGKPVFLSRFTALPEVGGNEAYYFNSFSEEEMVQTIEEGFKDYYENNSKADNIRKHASKFSWDMCINSYLDIYKGVLA